MTIKRTLSRLESEAVSQASTNIVEAIQEHGRTLAELLGRVDGLWWPLRYCPASLAVYQRQKRYRDLGIEWQSSGNDAAKWKSDERLRNELARCGLVTLMKSGGGVFLKMTPQAETAIRQLCGMIFVPSEILEFYISHIQKKEVEQVVWVRSGGWIQENRFFGCEYSDRPMTTDWLQSEETIISLLISGALECKSSSAGHVYYRLTGQAHAGGEVVEGITKDSAIEETYLDSWESETKSRKNWQPLDHHEIYIPISASK